MKNQYDIFVVRRPTAHTKVLQLEKSSVIGYFEYFITSYNFILLIPFRLGHSISQNVKTCKKHTLHQVLCGVLLVSGLFSTTFDFLDIVNTNMYEQPTMLFGVPIYAAEVIYEVVFFNVFWRKTEEISKFANLSAFNFLNQSKLLYAVITIYPLFLNILFMDQFTDYVPLTVQNNWYTVILQLVKAAGFLTNVVLSNFVDTYIAVLALTAYKMMRRSIAELEDLRKLNMAEECWKIGDFSSLTNIAKKLQTFFATLNSIGACIILTWFCMFVPWVSHKLVDTLPGTGIALVGESALSALTNNILNKNIIGKIYYWSYVGLYFLILVLCAEVKRECDNIKRAMKKIILQCDPNLIYGKAALVYIESVLENVGIHGGFFFSFSYGFLGSAAGLIVTYTILSLQLRLNCCSSSNAKPLNV